MLSETITTRYGVVRGLLEGDVAKFYNVPYARPPLGPLRFVEALPPEPWRGARDASAPGPIALQPPSGIGSYVPGDPTEQDEDCLSLNIFTTAGANSGRPVIVFVHGGAFSTGTGAGVMYDGSALAQKGPVVVTLNYRLGAFGFLAHPAFATSASSTLGNWALSDVVAALRFVREHAASFGGDAGNVTLVGESSGAMLVADLLALPVARGLFRRAILQSGAVLVDDLATASGRAEELARLLGVAMERESLSRVPASELLTASATLAESLGGLLSMPFRPVLEPGLLPEDPTRAIRRGAASGIDLLVGTNRDEFALFTLSAPGELFEDAAQLLEHAGRLLAVSAPGLDEAAGEFVDRYRDFAATSGPGSSKAAFDALAGDGVFRLPALRLAEAQAPYGRVFCYRFDWSSPFMNGALGACHGIELPFVFGTLVNPVIAMFAGNGERAGRLAEATQQSWVAFASTGDPSGSIVGNWPQYLPGRQTMLLGDQPMICEAPDEAARALWERHLPRYGDEEFSASGIAPGT